MRRRKWSGRGRCVRLEDVRPGLRVRVTRGAWRQVQGRTGTVVGVGDPQHGPPVRVQLDGWRRAYRFWPHEVQPETEPEEVAGGGA